MEQRPAATHEDTPQCARQQLRRTSHPVWQQVPFTSKRLFYPGLSLLAPSATLGGSPIILFLFDLYLLIYSLSNFLAVHMQIQIGGVRLGIQSVGGLELDRVNESKQGQNPEQINS